MAVVGVYGLQIADLTELAKLENIHCASCLPFGEAAEG